LNAREYQIIFSDTPGILDPTYKLQETMLKAARSALVDADILIYMTEPGENPDPDHPIIQKVARLKIPVLLVINKIDLSNQEEVTASMAKWDQVWPKAEKIPISALEQFNITHLFDRIVQYLPESPPYYPKDAFTDKSERFLAGEMIREKILIHYKQEIPYAVEVEIESFKEEPGLIRISAVIYVERESQKGILIGSEGKALKKIGREARLEMERFFRKKIFLQTRVKVKKDWRNNERQIKNFGYH
jgi:GTP-binding protein Era